MTHKSVHHMSEKELRGFSFDLLMFSEKAWKTLWRSMFEFHAEIVGQWAYDILPMVFNDDTPAKKFSQLRVGDAEEMTVEIHPHHLLYFARASGDFGAPHIDKNYAAGTHFKKPIAHGLLTGSFVSPILAHRLPGKGAVYGSQKFYFKAPVYIGDVLTVRVAITAIDQESMRITLSNTITNQDGKVVLEGESVAYPAEKFAKKKEE